MKITLFFAAFLLATPCFADAGATPVADSLVKPTSEWSGTLVLPEASARRADGGVWITLRNAPNADLKGKTVWLTYGDPSSSVEAREYYRQFLDVNFTSNALDLIAKSHLVLATPVNGWKRVSPLESLAAALPAGQMYVTLETPTWDGSQMIIHSEPIQISGHEMIYIRFNHSLDSNEFEVSHYDSSSKTFSGPTSVVRVVAPSFVQDDHMTHPISWSGIENFPQNPQGWLAFGDREADGTFDISAVEPTSLFSADTGFQEIQDQNKMLSFFNYQHWKLKAGMQGQERKTAIEFGTSLPQLLTMGSKFLVIHSFGGNKSTDPLYIGPLHFYSGHFAYGVAQVIPHPFTGQPKIDIVYNQIYASNSNSVVAGRNAYHHYADDTTREIAIVRPVSDVLVPLPELFHSYVVNGQTIEPERLIQTQFSLMQGWYRIGAGSGVTIVEPYTSCVQDSNQVLLNAILTLKQMTQSEPLKSWLKDGSHDPEVALFKSLMDWAKRANDKVGSNSPVFDLITGLQNGTYLPSGLRNPTNVNPLEFFLLTLRSAATIFPRATQDHLIEEGLELRRSMLLLDTFDTLSHDPQYAPIEPQVLIGISYVNPSDFPDSCSN